MARSLEQVLSFVTGVDALLRNRNAAMRFTYAEAMTRARFYAPLAQAAEAAGFTSMTVADSQIYPRESDSSYPTPPA